MTQTYFDPARADNAHALPDCEVFYHDNTAWGTADGEPLPTGWYWWACFPGCLPDGDPVGPFDTEEDALLDARDGIEDFE